MKPAASLREAVQDMRPLDALEHVLQAYEAIAGSDDEEIRVRQWLGCSPCEARIFVRLSLASGAAVSRQSLISMLDAAMISRRATSSDSLGPQIASLRRKLPEGYTIRNVWGHGYALETA